MLATQTGIALGHPIHESTIKAGLRELNPGLHFDLAAATGQLHPFIHQRQGVYFQGQHLCSMDRGMIPEVKQFGVRSMRVPAEWWEADKDDVSIEWVTIRPEMPGYRDLRELADKQLDCNYALRDDGSLMKMQPMKTIKARGRCITLGWRHTFEGILRHGLSGVNRMTLGAKFGVDMLKYPVGPPEEVAAALLEE